MTRSRACTDWNAACRRGDLTSLRLFNLYMNKPIGGLSDAGVVSGAPLMVQWLTILAIPICQCSNKVAEHLRGVHKTHGLSYSLCPKISDPLNDLLVLSIKVCRKWYTNLIFNLWAVKFILVWFPHALLIIISEWQFQTLIKQIWSNV